MCESGAPLVGEAGKPAEKTWLAPIRRTVAPFRTAIVVIWDRSPHSARKMSTNDCAGGGGAGVRMTPQGALTPSSAKHAPAGWQASTRAPPHLNDDC